jgi:hypothetical protein
MGAHLFPPGSDIKEVWAYLEKGIDNFEDLLSGEACFTEECL